MEDWLYYVLVAAAAVVVFNLALVLYFLVASRGSIRRSDDGRATLGDLP